MDKIEWRGSLGHAAQRPCDDRMKDIVAVNFAHLGNGHRHPAPRRRAFEITVRHETTISAGRHTPSPRAMAGEQMAGGAPNL